MRSWCGAAALAYAASVGVAQADTGEPGDTGVYVDTGARAEKVFVQDVGCGAGAGGLLALVMLFGGRRRRGPAYDRGPR